jgi:hypothetical protein
MNEPPFSRVNRGPPHNNNITLGDLDARRGKGKVYWCEDLTGMRRLPRGPVSQRMHKVGSHEIPYQSEKILRDSRFSDHLVSYARQGANQ